VGGQLRRGRVGWLGSRSPEGLLGGVKRLPLSGFRALRRAAGGRAERTGLTPGGASARDAPHVVRSRRHDATVALYLRTSHDLSCPPLAAKAIKRRPRSATNDRSVAQKTSTNSGDSPAMRVMEEAIDLAIEERSPYPDRAVFINADGPRTGAAIQRAIDEGRAVVFVAADGSASILRAEPVHS
jgi:hypothetical protein